MERHYCLALLSGLLAQQWCVVHSALQSQVYQHLCTSAQLQGAHLYTRCTSSEVCDFCWAGEWMQLQEGRVHCKQSLSTLASTTDKCVTSAYYNSKELGKSSGNIYMHHELTHLQHENEMVPPTYTLRLFQISFSDCNSQFLVNCFFSFLSQTKYRSK